MELNDSTLVAEIVTSNILTANVFKKNGINYCCEKGISLKEVCRKNDVSCEKIINEIKQLNSKKDSEFYSWDLEKLVDHIVEVHHKYVRESSQLILQYSDKASEVYGRKYVEILELNILLHELTKELEGHMKKEELILFPFIVNLAEAKKLGVKIDPPYFGSFKNPVKMMEREHKVAVDLMVSISEITANFKPPKNANDTFKELNIKLKEFQDDLFLHIHLENNILFPKAIELEREFYSYDIQ